jgi:hypothetical protein
MVLLDRVTNIEVWNLMTCIALKKIKKYIADNLHPLTKRIHFWRPHFEVHGSLSGAL